ncbi:hypothetical protein Salat_1946300 [Sesamum alatum]|uniref:Uncharacterized protein n=1 Tax=Sesamum alatum TaxID=300844 RepID=A0AAE2CIW6_9LAMI|nr:hypothetical protein Salat_1946300 [Sesamum alatum]
MLDWGLSNVVVGPLRHGDLVGGQEDDGGDARSGAVGGQSGGGVAYGGAADADEWAVHLVQSIDLANQNSHPQILETAGMANPPVFDPQIIHPEDFLAESLGPEEIGVTFEHADDVIIVDFGQDPFFLGPDAGAVKPFGGADAGIEQGLLVIAIVLFECFHVVLDVEEAAVTAVVHDVVEGVGFRGGGIGGDGVERDILGREAYTERRRRWRQDVAEAGKLG